MENLTYYQEGKKELVSELIESFKKEMSSLATEYTNTKDDKIDLSKKKITKREYMLVLKSIYLEKKKDLESLEKIKNKIEEEINLLEMERTEIFVNEFGKGGDKFWETFLDEKLEYEKY